MKILFLCSSLEPGRDGVGDYTRCIASELIRLGNICSIIALNDKFINGTNEVLSKVEQVGGIKIEVLRLPAGIPLRKRQKKAEQFTKRFGPDWISLQYVPHGYNKKGLPFLLPNTINVLKKTANYVKLHIMFHEIGIVHIKNTSPKQRLISFMQLHLRRYLISSCKPKVVNVNCDFYNFFLLRDKIKASILPLFGNLSLDKNSLSWKDLIPRSSVVHEWADYVLMVTFGSIHHSFPFEHFFDQLSSIYSTSGKRFLMLTTGYPGPNTALLEQWKTSANHSSFLRMYSIQRLSDKALRAVFNSADSAISLTWLECWQKSSSNATLMESGLQIFGYFGNLHPEFQLTSLSLPEQVVNIDSNPSQLKHPIRFLEHSLLPSISQKFLDELD